MEKEIVSAWWKAADTDYDDLEDEAKYLYVCDADAIIALVLLREEQVKP